MLVFDTETTGLIENLSTRLDQQPEIIEFCGIIVDPYNGKVYEILDRLIKPTVQITEEITKINGITNEMVKGASNFAFLAPSIRDIIEATDVVVAHNAIFDKEMVDLEFKRLGLTKIAWPQIICTAEATVHLTGYRLSLSGLYEFLFGEKFEGAHRAKADVEALMRCVVALRKRQEI